MAPPSSISASPAALPSPCTFDSPALPTAISGAHPSFGFRNDGNEFFGIPASFTKNESGKVSTCFGPHEPQDPRTTWTPVIHGEGADHTCLLAGGVGSLLCTDMELSALTPGTHVVSYKAASGYKPFEPISFVVVETTQDHSSSEPPSVATTSKAHASSGPTSMVVFASAEALNAITQTLTSTNTIAEAHTVQVTVPCPEFVISALVSGETTDLKEIPIPAPASVSTSSAPKTSSSASKETSSSVPKEPSSSASTEPSCSAQRKTLTSISTMASTLISTLVITPSVAVVTPTLPQISIPTMSIPVVTPTIIMPTVSAITPTIVIQSDFLNPFSIYPAPSVSFVTPHIITASVVIPTIVMPTITLTSSPSTQTVTVVSATVISPQIVTPTIVMPTITAVGKLPIFSLQSVIASLSAAQHLSDNAIVSHIATAVAPLPSLAAAVSSLAAQANLIHNPLITSLASAVTSLFMAANAHSRSEAVVMSSIASAASVQITSNVGAISSLVAANSAHGSSDYFIMSALASADASFKAGGSSLLASMSSAAQVQSKSQSQAMSSFAQALSSLASAVFEVSTSVMVTSSVVTTATSPIISHSTATVLKTTEATSTKLPTQATIEVTAQATSTVPVTTQATAIVSVTPQVPVIASSPAQSTPTSVIASSLTCSRCTKTDSETMSFADLSMFSSAASASASRSVISSASTSTSTSAASLASSSVSIASSSQQTSSEFPVASSASATASVSSMMSITLSSTTIEISIVRSGVSSSKSYTAAPTYAGTTTVFVTDDTMISSLAKSSTGDIESLLSSSIDLFTSAESSAAPVSFPTSDALSASASSISTSASTAADLSTSVTPASSSIPSSSSTDQPTSAAPSSFSTSASSAALVMAIGDIVCPDDDGQTIFADTGAVFLLECNVDRSDYDITDVDNPQYVNAGDIQTCVQICAITSGCVDVSLSGTACYLKSGLGFVNAAPGIIGAKQIAGAMATPRMTSVDLDLISTASGATEDDVKIAPGISSLSSSKSTQASTGDTASAASAYRSGTFDIPATTVAAVVESTPAAAMTTAIITMNGETISVKAGSSGAHNSAVPSLTALASIGFTRCECDYNTPRGLKASIFGYRNRPICAPSERQCENSHANGAQNVKGHVWEWDVYCNDIPDDCQFDWKTGDLPKRADQTNVVPTSQGSQASAIHQHPDLMGRRDLGRSFALGRRWIPRTIRPPWADRIAANGKFCSSCSGWAGPQTTFVDFQIETKTISSSSILSAGDKFKASPEVVYVTSIVTTTHTQPTTHTVIVCSIGEEHASETDDETVTIDITSTLQGSQFLGTAMSQPFTNKIPEVDDETVTLDITSTFSGSQYTTTVMAPTSTSTISLVNNIMEIESEVVPTMGGSVSTSWMTIGTITSTSYPESPATAHPITNKGLETDDRTVTVDITSTAHGSQCLGTATAPSLPNKFPVAVSILQEYSPVLVSIDGSVYTGQGVVGEVTSTSWAVATPQ